MIEIVDLFIMFYIVNDLFEGIWYKFDVVVKLNNGEGLRSIFVEVKIIDFSEFYYIYDDEIIILCLLLIYFYVDIK